MALKTKSILAPIEKTDGTRISVMNRHTLNDGITPDERIRKDLYDKHMAALAPSNKLIGDYYKRGLPWNEYEKRFKEEIKKEQPSKILKDIASKALKEDITLLCIEESPEFCHRRLLAEECRECEPNLEIKIK